jgi:uncharacterized membrane protein
MRHVLRLRTLRAFVIAPIVPALLYWAIGTKLSWAALPGVLVYGGLFGYFAILIVGVPAYRLITTHSRLRAHHVFLISGIVGVATPALMSSVVDARTLGAGMLLGLSAGIVFWILWRGNAAQPAVAADGASRRR